MRKWLPYRGPRLSRPPSNPRSSSHHLFSTAKAHLKDSHDPRIREFGRRIHDDYATIRENYGMFFFVYSWLSWQEEEEEQIDTIACMQQRRNIPLS